MARSDAQPTPDLLIKNAAFVLTMDGHRTIIENGAVVVREGTIQAVGTTDDIERTWRTADLVIDARGKVVTPGLIDAHIHLHHALVRGLMDDVPYYPEAIGRMHGLVYPNLDESDYYIGGLLNLIEMIKTGTTCFVDCGVVPSHDLAMESAVVRGVREIGIRAVLGRGLFDVYERSGYDRLRATDSVRFVRETTDQALERADEFVARLNGKPDDLVTGWVCVTQVNSASDELFRGAKAIADRRGVGLLTHAAVIEPMVELTRALTGKRDIERLHALGVLGPNVLAAHMGWLSPDELRMVQESGMHVVHCVSSSMHCGYGSCARGRFPEMYARGVNICLGCDGAVESNHLDMVRQMYLAAIAHKEVRYDTPTALPFPPEQALEMATVNGAKATLMPARIGSLEVNKRADIVIFDAMRPEWIPLHRANVVSNLVYSATGDSAHTVIVDGRVVMRDRKILTVDESAVMRRAQAASQKFVDKAWWLP
jgi:5-methylthioadenosine/S-adenosylhomocysteine deaminase